MNIFQRLSNAYDAFKNKEPTDAKSIYAHEVEYSSLERSGSFHMYGGSERTIINSVYNRIAIDVAAIPLNHVQVDENGRYLAVKDTGLNRCLSLQANKDETARTFIRDVVISLFTEGNIGVLPVDVEHDPATDTSYDIYSMRVCKILQWFPDHILLEAYNDKTGKKQRLLKRKQDVALIENPFYSVMNEPNSTLKRLSRKLVLLDLIDEHTGSNKLDMIIQLPYSTRNPVKEQAANSRIESIETQLRTSKYGIAYIDGSEKVIQLNRSLENNLLEQIKYLTETLLSQLGITQKILDNTASDEELNNYYFRIIEPVISAIVDEYKIKFITDFARSNGQSIMFFRNPFRMLAPSKIADTADKLTRNEIMSSNEVRQEIGLRPSTDPKADELRNKNISQAKDAKYASTKNDSSQEKGEVANE